MTRTLWRRPRPSATRSTQARFVVEGLEERTVLSTVAPLHGIRAGIAHVARAHEHAHPHAHAKGAAHHPSPVSISSVVVNDVALSGDQLLANATINGTIRGHAFSLPAVLPVTLTPATTGTSPSGTITPAAATTSTPILNLSLGALNLSLLGLDVHLGSTCNFGDTQPITVKISANPADGAIGSLLSGVANLLNGSGGTGTAGGTGAGLTSLGSSLGTLETDLTSVLNGILGGLNSGNSAATGTTMAAPAGQHEILDLDLNPLNLDLLGLQVQTSNICLNLTSVRGPGNLLGNLLG